jgi:hypothetical protein
MNKKLIIPFTFTLLCAACSDATEEVLTYADDAQAMHIAVEVDRATRAVASDATALPEGATVSLSESSGSGYIDYTVRNGEGDLEPVGNSFLRWKKSSVTEKELYACSPEGSAVKFTLSTNQSTSASLTAADYLTFAGTVQRRTVGDDANAVTFRLSHRLAKVNVTIKQGGNGTSADGTYKYDGCVFNMKIYSCGNDVTVSYDNATASTDDADDDLTDATTTASYYTPYTATLTVQNTSSTIAVTPYGGSAMDFTQANTATAIVVPCSADSKRRFIEIQPYKGSEALGSPMYFDGMPAIEAGHTYTYELTIEEDVIYINEVKVTNWTENSDVVGDDANTYDWYTLNLDDYADYAAVKAAAKSFAPYFKKIRVTGAMKSGMSYNFFNGFGSDEMMMYSSYPTTHLDISQVTGGGTSLASWSFYGSSLQEIYLPEEVTSIGEYAFAYCSNLTSMTIPASVTYIGKFAFRYSYALSEFIVEDADTDLQIGDGSSSDLWTEGMIETLYIGRNVTFTADRYGPFDTNSDLVSVELGTKLTEVKSWSFYQNYSMTTVTLPNTITRIGEGAFCKCTSLETLTIPSSVTSIGKEAFRYSGLKTITLPSSVTSIGDKAFADCSNLEEVIICNSEENVDVSSSAFDGSSNVQVIYQPSTENSIDE